MIMKTLKEIAYETAETWGEETIQGYIGPENIWGIALLFQGRNGEQAYNDIINHPQYGDEEALWKMFDIGIYMEDEKFETLTEEFWDEHYPNEDNSDWTWNTPEEIYKRAVRIAEGTLIDLTGNHPTLEDLAGVDGTTIH